jgi:hypothetical protein
MDEMVVDAGESARCPIDYVALPLLAAGGTLIGNARWGNRGMAGLSRPLYLRHWFADRLRGNHQGSGRFELA